MHALSELGEIIGYANEQFERAVRAAAFIVGRLVVAQDSRCELAVANLREAKYRSRLVDAKWARRHGRSVPRRTVPRRDVVAVGADSVSSGREIRPKVVPWVDQW